MTRVPLRTKKRPAFTLIELMIVILILVILISLLAGAVLKVMGRVPEVKTRTEIAELSVALQAFMNDYQLSDPPPSYLVLRENIAAYNANNALELQSITFLKRVFGKNLGVGQTYVDWNGDGVANGPWYLEGEQCLIFFIGGIPNTQQMVQQVAAGQPPVPGPQGFSTNNSNPSSPGGKRRGPYFTLDSTRLKFLVPYASHPQLPFLLTQTQPTQSPLFVYLDSWLVKTGTMPYAYFSSQGLNNTGYLTNFTGTSHYPMLDCGSISATPYWTAQNVNGVPTQFTYSNTFQIISAGKNGTFGGGLWNPSGAVAAGADDQANFSSTILGIGQN
jgi:prepilin-type N-terminal cleavage/methylation domain-containing protein